MKPNTIAFALIFCAATTAAQPSAEQKVFGMPGAATGTTAAKTPEPQAASKTVTPSVKTARTANKLPPQAQAKQMYDRFNAGDLLYASKLKDAANAGNPWAALQYGFLAHRGRLPGQKGVNLALAHKAYMKAVRQGGTLTGNHLAAYNLGLIYYYGGNGFAKDGREALKWFGLANQSYREFKKSQGATFWPAALYSAQMLENGYGGVKADKAAARVHWQAAARANDPAALYGLGRSVAPENPFVAIASFKKAADRWHVPSMLALAKWYSTNDKLHQADPVQAAAWLQTAAMVDRRYSAQAAGYSRRLNAKQQRTASSKAAQWFKSRGMKPPVHDYSAPLNEDPAAR